MLSIPGYEVSERIYGGGQTVIYRGRRKLDNIPVIVKTLKNPYPSLNETLRFEHEYTMLHNLGSYGVVRAYSFETVNNRPVIVMEDFYGQSLDTCFSGRQTGTKETLMLFIRIAEIVEDIHKQQVIHKDINPSNIVWNQQTGQVKLIDFGISSLVVREGINERSIDDVDGTIAYVSPEQTGRVHRPVDFRSDLYSLGVTFYELLTGVLPFDSSDPFEIVYSHLARVPKPVSTVNPDTPRMISEIVMKLMAKNADERYQSAFGLKTDLEQCLESFRGQGFIPVFDLACHDTPDYFAIPEKLFGRGMEIETLLSAYDRVCKGPMELIIVTGPAGIGKSSFASAIARPVMDRGGLFISGQFEHLKSDIPYTAVIRAFQRLIRSLVAQSPDELAVWKERLLSALKPNGAVISNVIPELEWIIGKQPDVSALPPIESRNRFHLVFQNFVSVFIREKHPLVIFLDDIQWADLPTLNLLENLFSGQTDGHLLVIFSCRKATLDVSHPFMLLSDRMSGRGVPVRSVHLGPLLKADVNRLVAETLRKDDDSVSRLANICFEKTGGNPFFLGQFLRMLHEDGMVRFDRGQRVWRVDIDAVRRLKITDNVVDFMIAKLKRLPESCMRILKTAACTGNQFDVRILCRIHSRLAREIDADLWPALLDGMIVTRENLVPARGSGVETQDIVYAFSHNRIHQAVYSLVDPTEKTRLHARIGQELLVRADMDAGGESLFDIVNHLNIGRDLMADDKQKQTLAGLNLQAGVHARTSAAYESAFYYFKSGIEILGPGAWKSQYRLAMDLHNGAAEAAYLISDTINLDFYSEAVLKNAANNIDKIKVYEVRTLAYIASNRLMDAIRTGLRALRLLGIRLPLKPGSVHVIAGLLMTRGRLWHKKAKDIVRQQSMTDPARIAAMRMLLVVSSPAFFAVPELLPLISFQQIRLSLKYGNARETPVALAVLGLIECGVTGRIDSGFTYGESALNMVRHLDAREHEAKTLVIFNSQIRHWKVHAKETLAPLLTAYQIGLETGDLEYAAYGVHIHCCNCFCIGKNLASLERNMESYTAAILRLNQKTAYNFQQIWHQSLLNLRSDNKLFDSLTGRIYDETRMLPRHFEANDRTAVFDVYFHKLMLCFFFERYEQGVSNADMAEKYADGVTAMLYVPVMIFYSCLVRISRFRQAGEGKGDRLLTYAIKLKKKMKKWAEFCPENYFHKYCLMEAECSDVAGDESRAREFYKKAIESAAKYEYLNERAVANECFGRFWIDKKELLLAGEYLSKARDQYHVWGADAKVSDMESRYAGLFEKSGLTEFSGQTGGSTARTGALSKNLDSIAVLKASQAISGEIHLPTLLKKMMKLVMENAGAQAGILLLKREADFTLEAELTEKSTEISVLAGTPIKDADLPEPIIRFVERTHETVVLDDASNEEMYANDPYLLEKKPKSILCMPIVHQKFLVGILYAENNLIFGAFTRKHLESLKVIATQAAIALENAMLYDDLRRAELKVRTLIKTANEGFVELDNDAYITDVNPEMCAILGMSHSQLIGRNIMTTVDQSNADIFKSELVLRQEGKRSAYEITFDRPDNSRVHCIIKATPLFEEGKQVGSFAMVTDITERKVSEEKIRRLNEELENRVKERTAELERSLKNLIDAQKKLVEAEKMASLGGLVAGIAHEVNTPVGVSVTAASFLQEKTVEMANIDPKDPGFPGFFEKYMKAAVDSSSLILANLKRAADLVRSFKQVAVDQTAGQQRRFDLKGYLDEVLLSMHPKFKHTRHAVTVDCPEGIEINSYPGAIAQIITNLVMNSLIHGFDGVDKGEIHICAENVSDNIRLIYRDNGRGMEADVAGRVFEPFFTTRRSGGGTGLGMHIVFNQVTQTLGGSIECKSVPGQGVEFTILIPVV
ncbi:MAG: AAA family ATPase [Deltaproteobacteria bacterium]|nr:AAA family ATPase [Deltaproteobacteria bacterium]